MEIEISENSLRTSIDCYRPDSERDLSGFCQLARRYLYQPRKTCRGLGAYTQHFSRLCASLRGRIRSIGVSRLYLKQRVQYTKMSARGLRAWRSAIGIHQGHIRTRL